MPSGHPAVPVAIRQCIIRCAFEDKMSYQDIADTYGTTLVTVHNIIKLHRRMYREFLACLYAANLFRPIGDPPPIPRRPRDKRRLMEERTKPKPIPYERKPYSPPSVIQSDFIRPPSMAQLMGRGNTSVLRRD